MTVDAPSSDVAGEREGEPAEEDAVVFRIVEVQSVRMELPDQHPVVTLQEVEPLRRQVAFRIGIPEGAALAHAVARTQAPRPLCQDLFAETLQRFGIEVLAVRLVGRRAATYLAELELMGSTGREMLSCRPSDGIALALRQRVPAPVLVDERLFDPGDVDPVAGAAPG